MVENYRAVLGANIRPLPIAVVGLWFSQKTLSKLSQEDFGRVVFHLHYFRVAGAVCANIIIRGVRHRPTLVSHRCGCYARNLPERRLYAPEAAGAKCCFFGHNYAPILWLS